jgi:hypothetical protein
MEALPVDPKDGMVCQTVKMNFDSPEFRQLSQDIRKERKQQAE